MHCFQSLELPDGLCNCCVTTHAASAQLLLRQNSHPVQQLLLCCAGNPDAAVNGGLAIAVPLELKGLWLAHQRHGSLAWADLVTPVIPLAQDGFPLHPYLADEIGDGEW